MHCLHYYWETHHFLLHSSLLEYFRHSFSAKCPIFCVLKLKMIKISPLSLPKNCSILSSTTPNQKFATEISNHDCICTHLNTVVGQLKKIRRTCGAHGTESNVIKAKVFRAWQHIGIRIHSANQLAHNDAYIIHMRNNPIPKRY